MTGRGASAAYVACERCASVLRDPDVASLLPAGSVREAWLARYHAEGHPSLGRREGVR